MRIVLLASGSGTLTQAVLSAPAARYQVAAVGTDQPQAQVLRRARTAGVDEFAVPLADYADRADWNAALADAVAQYDPDWVVSAGFMRILGPEFISRFPQRILNTHPALLPAFPGAHGVRDALAYGVKVTGTTIHLVDEGVDTGPILGQYPVAVRADDTEDSLHERIKEVERRELVNTLNLLARSTVTVTGRRADVTARPSKEAPLKESEKL